MADWLRGLMHRARRACGWRDIEAEIALAVRRGLRPIAGGVIVDGTTPFNAANVPHKSGADTITGPWQFTLPVATPGGVNFTRNGNFEVWLAGTAVAPTGWTLTGAGASVARDGTNRRLGSYAAAVTRVGNDCYLGENVAALLGPIAWWQGKTVVFGCWVRATVASRARLAINDGVGTTFSGYHTGGSAFEWLQVSRTLDGAATQVEVRLAVDTGNTTAQFDGATLALGSGIPDFMPGILDATSGDAPTTIAEQWQFDRAVGTAGGHSWVYNGDMEVWGGGASAAPTGWTLAGAGATVARNTSNVKIGARSAAVTRAGTNCYLVQNVPSIAEFGPVARWQGQVVTVGCWVRATVASAARLSIHDGVGSSASGTHTGGGAFEWLQISRTIDAAATIVELRLEVLVDTTVQFDGVTFVFGASVQNYIPGSWRGRKMQVIIVGATTQGASLTRFYSPSGAVQATEVLASWRTPWKCVARKLYADTDANLTTNTTVFTLRTDEANDTLLTATIPASARSGSELTIEVALTAGQLIDMQVVSGASVGTRTYKATFELEEVP